ncbi:hypothetical protein [Botrimarina mediterranea]|uniref:PEP-CTERM protein-sorting domain-containing protein n=1 Tax=Botrimarina mediterranea TaxID=2528022 RepID=A0A518K407_9BACT|nr:hypothetical protein [Botrimarina mediterranea]QDV72509.1 hypothetical protein Spa11_06870 [Botrimarina mediterranea]QDV77081.1 hypothetical protein K2D_06680 [Planctomycetes bacterium K2D]
MKNTLLAAAIATLLACGQSAIAQPGSAFLAIWNAGSGGSGTGNWNDSANWAPMSVPSIDFDDFAVINGGGTATISSSVPDAGGAYLGQNAGQSGTISIVPGGAINFVAAPAFDADGGVRIGSGGTGTLVMTGGAMSAASLTSGGEAGSLIDLSGSPSVNVGSASLARTTQITGSGVNFSTTGTFTLTGTHSLVQNLSSGSASTINVGSTAAIGGALNVNFSGYTPTITDSWDLISASNITGVFGSITSSGVALGAGQAFNVRTVDDGADKVLQLFLEQQLVLDVNRDTGVVSITNPGTSAVLLDGYSVRSPSGLLNQGAWNPLATQFGSGWTQANPSATALNEIINGAGTTNIGGGQSVSLGAVYQPAPTEFGTDLDDLVFQYTGPGNGNITASIDYSGAGVINDLVLYVNPTTGQATMRNASPFNVEIDGYTITSESGALNTGYTSLDDAGVESGQWQEANPSSTRVSELMDGGVTEMSIHRSFDLGSLVTGGAEDLAFQYLLAGESTPRTGTVVYETAPAQVALPGDYNNDGAVNAADYTVWRDALGTATTLPGDTSPGGVSAVDYTVWASNYGRTLGGSSALAVPEPSSVLILLGLLGLPLVRRARAAC